MKINDSFVKITQGYSIPLIQSALKKPDNTENTCPVENKKNLNKKTPLEKRVLYAVVAVGAIALVLTKGFSGFTAKFIKKYADKLENNLLKNADKNKLAQYFDNGIANTSKSAKRMFSYSKAIANITAIKDSLFKKFYSFDYIKFKNPETRMFPKLAKFWNYLFDLPSKFFNFATKNIVKITDSAIDSKYNATTKALDKYIAKCTQIIENANTTPEAKLEAKALLDKLLPAYMKGFSKISRETRLNNLDKGLSNLSDKVYDVVINPFKVLFTKKKIPFTTKLKIMGRRLKRNYSSYITMAQSNSERLKHGEAVNSAKILFSNDINDISKSLQNIANEMKHSFNPKDISSRQIFGDILRKIDKYGELSGSSESAQRLALKNEITNNMDAILKQISESISAAKGSNNLYTLRDLENISKYVNSMKQTMTAGAKKGAVQEFLTSMKDILSDKDYKLLKLKTEQLNRVFNDAVDAEMNKMVDKYAEAKVGSIPTDVSGQAIVLGTGAYYIVKGDDKKERVGAALKVGVPILGGLATYFYSAAKAFSGTKNLLYTALAGFILNRVGDSIFNRYKNNFNNEKTLVKTIDQNQDQKPESIDKA